jgi:hypothetical protein
MYKLLEYYICEEEIKFHITTMTDTEEKMNEAKDEIAIKLRNMEIEPYEIMFTKNINSIKNLLKRENIKVFKVIKD